MKRKGFVKYCLQFGYRLHPVYSFGEEKSFSTFTWFLNLRLKLNQFGIPGVLFWGDKWIPFFPRRDARIVTVIGDAIELPHIEEPSKEDVDKWHAIYVEELKKLFEKHKETLGIKEELEIY